MNAHNSMLTELKFVEATAVVAQIRIASALAPGVVLVVLSTGMYERDHAQICAIQKRN